MLASSVIVFPGQGSQSIGMLDSFIQNFEETTRTTIQEASQAIGVDLLELATTDSQQKINQTAYTQPLMLCADTVVWRILKSHFSETPQVLAGHSLGEYAALVASEVINLTDATRLVHLRGKAMQQAVAEGVGAVAAILGLADSQVQELCKQSLSDQQIVEAVNFNAPGQVVIAGHKAAVERALQKAKEQGAKRAVLLPLSVPVHCQLMKPARVKLQVLSP